MKKYLILSIFIISGCAYDPNYRLKQFSETCKAYGFPEGSLELANCVKAKDEEWIEKTTYKYEPIPYIPQNMPKNNTMNCTSMNLGGGLGTINCH